MVRMIDYTKIPSPCFVLDESRLRANLKKIASVASAADVEIIVALKANAMWSIFPIMKEYVNTATASSLAEARLVFEEFGALAHTYAPVYTDREIDEILNCSSHITFNSIAQFKRFGARAILRGISCGLRVNPGYSPVDTDIYNPCVEGSRLGVSESQLQELPDGIEGLHFHNLCESFPHHLEKTLENVEERFGHILPKVKWINMGGGHLITHKDYDSDELVRILKEFKQRHPHLKVILEPGSAFTWRTGELVSTVEDVVVNGGVNTLMLNVSFACHMPDCLEMPYKPNIIGARDAKQGDKRWRVGGNSCLAGDFMGDWTFDEEPKVGDRIVFEDMIHYTMVKTTMFNGVTHPSIAIWREEDSTLKMVREFGYEDYKNRMS